VNLEAELDLHNDIIVSVHKENFDVGLVEYVTQVFRRW
jgi:hypothetical protein